jgi:hypothetical protein
LSSPSIDLLNEAPGKPAVSGNSIPILARI